LKPPRFNLNFDQEKLQKLIKPVGFAAIAFGLSYMTASSVSAILMSVLAKNVMVHLVSSTKRTATTASLMHFGGATSNYHSLQRMIKERNLFNSSGAFPEESAGALAGDESSSTNFDISAPCKKSTLNVSLVGTIYISDNSSLATIQEQGFGEADIYREGDGIVGNESATLVKIERNRAIINNNGSKECLELVVLPPKIVTESAKPVVIANGSKVGGAPDAPPSAGGDCNLQEKYVQDELGSGFATIIQKARFVPNTSDNQMNGFKIFAIEPQSLFARAGLQNGDIITQVNETSLKQPDQGFALYQAFNDEREVRIHILRGGATPMMITCRIN
jgi:general secretion pathway protein C